MRKSTFGIMILGVATLSGCSLMPIAPPAYDNSQAPSVVVLNRYPDQDYEKSGALYKVPNSHFGVYFVTDAMAKATRPPGAFVILAATSASERVGQSINGITSINAANLLAESNPVLRTSNERHPREFALIPSAILVFQENKKKFTYECQVTAEYDAGNSNLWKAYYSVERPGTDQYDPNDPTEQKKFAASLKQCLFEAKTLFMDHITGKLGPIKTRRIKRVGGYVQSLPIFDQPLPERAVHGNGSTIIQFNKGFEILPD